MSAILQNAKGPAAIAVAPSRGSTNPTKDKEMNSTKDSITSAAMPAPKLTDEQIADATADLETDVTDLMLMSRITASIISRFFNGPYSSQGEILKFAMTVVERDEILFAVSDVEFRSRMLNSAYQLARYGEVR